MGDVDFGNTRVPILDVEELKKKVMFNNKVDV